MVLLRGSTRGWGCLRAVKLLFLLVVCSHLGFWLAVQHECIPQAILGMDLICQAKSGMGKTAVFVLSLLQQLEPKEKTVSCLVLCHTRELSFQVGMYLCACQAHFRSPEQVVLFANTHLYWPLPWSNFTFHGPMGISSQSASVWVWLS